MRAMFLEFPNDPTCWTLEHQYMFGDALMVAPVCEEGETTTIYFPEGRWQDIWNKETFTGPSWRKYHAPLHKIPVFQKCNTILPLGPVRQHVSECQPEPLELWAFVDERADLTLRGDDRLLIVSAKRTAGELETTVKRGNWLFNTIDRIQADYHLSYEKY